MPRFVQSVCQGGLWPHAGAIGPGHSRCIAWMTACVPPGEQGKHEGFPWIDSKADSITAADGQAAAAALQFPHQHVGFRLPPPATTSSRQRSPMPADPLEILGHHGGREGGEGCDLVFAEQWLRSCRRRLRSSRPNIHAPLISVEIPGNRALLASAESQRRRSALWQPRLPPIEQLLAIAELLHRQIDQAVGGAAVPAEEQPPVAEGHNREESG